MVRVDGKPFRLMGKQPAESASLPQTSVLVLPTRTIYTFANDKVRVQLVFLTPAIPSDIEVLARPVTYLSYLVRSLDGQSHDVQFYADAGGEIAVNNASEQKVMWERAAAGEVTALRLGSVDQPVLAKRGDDVRIDWGYLYLAAPTQKGLQSVLSAREDAQGMWARTGNLPTVDDTNQPRTPNDGAPVAALALDVGKVGAQPVKRTVMFAYDDEYSLNWMGRSVRPVLAAQRHGCRGFAESRGQRLRIVEPARDCFRQRIDGRFARGGRRKIRAPSGVSASSGFRGQ